MDKKGIGRILLRRNGMKKNLITGFIVALLTLALVSPVFAVRRSGNRLATPVSLQGGYELIGDGSTTVTTAGTRVQLATGSVAAARCTICASSDSRGVFAIGGSTVIAALSGRRGITLASGDCIDVYPDYLDNVYVDSTVSGDSVNYIYYEYNG